MTNTLCIDPGIASTNGTGWTHYFAPKHEPPWLVACGLVQGENRPLPQRCRDIVQRVGQAYARNAHSLDNFGILDVLVMEHMNVYPIARMKGDPKDLIELAYLEGCFDQLGAKFTKLVAAAEWKGQVPEKIMRERIERSLNEGERQTVRDVIKAGKMNAKEAMNVWVSAGIGLHHFGRLR